MSGLIYELDEAERKAWDSLSRYKFVMFGYWVGVWVHLNRIAETRHSNPWQGLVKHAKAVRAKEPLPKFKDIIGLYAEGKAEISFTVTEEEKTEIMAYCQRKKRWRTSSDLARDALWQLMARNPIYKKHAQKEAKTEGVSDFYHQPAKRLYAVLRSRSGGI